MQVYSGYTAACHLRADSMAVYEDSRWQALKAADYETSGVRALSLAVVIGLTSWMSISKVVRAEVRVLRESEYVQASKCMGGGFLHILRVHLAPNFLPSILFMVIMNVRSAILAESTLSFLGLGLPLEIVSWGSMLSLSEKALLSGSWWIIVIPGLFLIVTLLCLTEIGSTIRRKLGLGQSVL